MDFQKIALENKILEIRIGSHLFGTDTPDSDLDLFGIFMPCDEIVFGGHRCEEVDLSIKAKDDTGRNTADAVDRKFHEYRKFVRLAMQNNPNILHVLFADEKNIVFQDGFGQRLLEMAHLFPHKGAHHRFVKYADSQRHKMRIKPENYAALEDGLYFLQFFRDDQVIGEVARQVGVCGTNPSSVYVDSGVGKHIGCGDLNFERGTSVRKAKRMIRERLSKASSRYVLYTKYGYDTKFGSNLIQLLMEGIELMETGRIEMPLKYANHVLDVKDGKYTVEQIMEWADGLVEDARVAFENSDLPVEPRTKEIEKFAMEEVKRFVIG